MSDSILEKSQQLRIEMEKTLKKNRFDHTLGVAYTAANMAFVFDEDVERSIEAGMNAHLSKPVEPDELYETMARLIIDRDSKEVE